MGICFSSICGNDAVKALLTHQITSASLAHAYLIEGDSGTGKTLLAQQICMALACTSAQKPCGECDACRKIAGGLTPDIISVAPAPDKKQITVDQIRTLRSEAVLSFTELPFKAFLIKPADAMNDAAQNALLKVLEEPPASVYFFLLTDRPASLLPTVRSRVQCLKTTPLPEQTMRAYLTETLPEARRMAQQDANGMDDVIRQANGSIGKAKELLLSRKKAFDPKPLAKAYLEKLSESSHSAFQLYAATLCKDRAQLLLVIEALLKALRDLCLVKKTQNASCLFFESKEDASALSARFTFAALMELHLLFVKTAQELSSNVNLSTAQLLLAERAWMAKTR